MIRPDTSAERDGVGEALHGRVRVHGKFFNRRGHRLRIKGVTYGPFAPDPNGEQFPCPDQARQDLARMRAAGLNSVRTYHVPPAWLLEQAEEFDVNFFVDVPWSKHLCFLDARRFREEARDSVRQAALRARRYPSVIAISIGNEIPPDIVRWHRPRRVEQFLHELFDVAKQADPGCLATYGNYPPTEYLDLSFLDFATVNVYLHDREVFRRYVLRLQNLVGEKPLVIGELGMDTLRHGETAQANFLAGHVSEITLLGLAGTFVFSWTDDWYTGGHHIQNWAFGITHADRFPKASYHALREVFESSPASLLVEKPRVSVVVCSYNGGSTLGQCLQSLIALDYPDYEVIVVDDGSADDTRDILGRFPQVRVIHQENRGLSSARNAGLRAARGTVVAYTDSDCFADPDWLSHLVSHLQRSGAAAVGGPNLTPDDGWLATCVAAAPGQPMHVLENDQVAEHIPGCNMAFHRDALVAINGFDPQYRKAGDDVDVCWRLQQAGFWITFAPGACVWHHRRQNVAAYLRQQAGYGEAEALLRFKHPDKFNSRGNGKWRGVLYGASLQGLRLFDAIIYRGTFGTGPFQCIYQAPPAHWAMVPTTFEWQILAILTAVFSLLWSWGWIVPVAMFSLSLSVAVLQAVQARIPSQYDSLRSRLLVMALCYAQPTVRSWHRYRTRVFGYTPPRAPPRLPPQADSRLTFAGKLSAAYWSEIGHTRCELLGLVIAYLTEHGWGKTIDSGWSEWDLQVYCHPWTVVQISTAQEDHAHGSRLIRVRYRLHLSGYTKFMAGAMVICFGGAALLRSWLPAALATVFLVGCLAAWVRGVYRAAHAVGVLNAMAHELGMMALPKSAGNIDEPVGASAGLQRAAIERSRSL